MKNYEIEYRDCTSMRCGVEIKALHEKEAIINLQKELIEDGDYMTELISIDEKCFLDNEYCKCDDCNPDNPGEWTLEDGTPLNKSDQETLNYAFENYVNEDGLTLEQAMERASQNKNK